jgi:hydrogenase expression/formation protein HypC
VLGVATNEQGVAMGTVRFGGITKEVCFACLPDARVGEYVIVHVGFAISRVDEAEARRVFELLRAMDNLAELDAPGS